MARDLLKKVNTKRKRGGPTTRYETGNSHPSRSQVQIGRQGRLVVPADIRDALGLNPGDKLYARVEDNRLVLEKRERILARLKARFKTVPENVSLVDELIEERRAEAGREQES